MKNAGLLFLQKRWRIHARKLQKTILFSLTLSAFVFSYRASATQVSGTLTIDPNGTASNTVFNDFRSAYLYLTSTTARPDNGPANSGAPFGVSGPVTFQVAAGTYTFTSQFSIGAITGASATNTITFDGGTGNAANVILTGNVNNTALLQLNACQYVRLYNLSIINTASSSSYAGAVHMVNASKCQLKWNILSIPVSYNTNSFSRALYMNGSTSFTSSTNMLTTVDSIIVDSNTISNGYYGIYAYGNTTANTNNGFSFTGNTINNTYGYGIYLYYVQLKVNYNTVKMSPAYSNNYGIGSDNSAITGSYEHEVIGNRVSNATAYGIYLSNCYNSTGSGTYRTKVYNNMVSTTGTTVSAYGIHGSNCLYTDYYHNTVNHTVNTTSNSYAALFTSGTGCNIRNNILTVSATGGTGLSLYCSTTPASVNNNNYYNAAGTNLLYTPANGTSNSTNYLTASPNSSNTNIQFKSTTDLRLSDPCFKIAGANLTANVPYDINGNLRNTSAPVLGCDEPAAAFMNDLAVKAFISPVIPFTSGNQTITLSVKNTGSNTISSANFTYAINNAVQGTATLASPLASCATTSISFPVSFNFAANTGYSVSAWSDNPNGAADADRTNDTVTLQAIGPVMSGAYTIDQGAASSATNFTSFTAAINALQTRGVSGPVTFTVMGTVPYNEQLMLPAIPGASAVNTITFDGGTGNAANRILTYAFPSINTGYAVWHLNGADYIRITNLTIRSTSTSYGYGLLLNNQADNNIINNCIIDLSSVTNTTIDFSCGIAFTASAFSLTSQGNQGSNNLISNCQVTGSASGGPSRGINFYGNSTTGLNQNNQVIGNTITNFTETGIYLYYSFDGTIIRDNSISRPARTGGSTVYGIYLLQSFQNVTVERNRIFNPYGGSLTNGNTFYGIFAQSSSTLQGNVIRNNAIYNLNGTGQHYGIYDYNNLGMAIYNNTISMDFATAKTNSNADYGIYVQMANSSPAYTKDIRNNIITLRRGGTGTPNRFGLYLADAFPNLISNYNLILVNAPSANNVAVYQVGSNMSLSVWKNSNNQQYDQNSVSYDPVYTNLVSNVTPTGCGIDNLGTQVAGVTTDITGASRSSTPDIGAYEFSVTPAANNAAVLDFDGITAGLCSGGINSTVTIKNVGTADLTSAKIDWILNGTPQTQVVWSGNLAAGASIAAPLGTVNFTANAVNSIKAYITEVNNTTDACALNDTAAISAMSSMSGVYTINVSGSGATNYTNFTNAIAALTARGVCGPVTFNVAPGPYSEQVVITPVAGASSTNTITFDGGSAAGTTLTYGSSNSSQKYTMRFDNAQWIRVKNLSIIASGTQAWPIHFFNNASNIQIKNCIISCTQTLTSQVSTSYIGIVFSNSVSSATTGSSSMNVDIDSNTITNGWYGLSLYGVTSAGQNIKNISITNNKIDSSGFYGIYAYYNNSNKVTDNTVNMRKTNGASTSSAGVYFQNVTSTATDAVQVNRNKINNSAQYGIFLNGSGGSASTLRAQMINNAIGGGFTSNTASGIYVQNSTYWDVYFNSVNLDNAATSTAQCLYMVTGSPNSCDIRNNNFAVSHTGATGAVCYRAANGATPNVLNYNNYFKAGATGSTNIINIAGTGYTLSNFTSTGGSNSISQNPAFTSATNLLPTVNTNKGVAIPSVQLDINGNYRNVPPDLGAYEQPITTPVDLGIISMNLPDSTLPLGSHQVEVTVRNFGSTPITSFNLKHTVNGSNIQDTAISGINLAQFSAMTINMGAGKPAVLGMMANTLKVFIDQPNGSADGNQLNDSMITGPRFPSLSGVFTIDAAGSGNNNFTSFNAAVTALNSGGVSGPVIFNVATDTFSEQVLINTINGASATNTIRFIGNGINNTLLTFAGAATPNHYTVRLSGTNWVSFENMTLNGGGTTANWVVHMMNASNCTIKKCRVNLSGAAVSSSSSNYIPVIANGHLTSEYNGGPINNIVIDSNIIEYGYYGVMMNSNNNTFTNYVRGNTINNAYYFGLNFYNSQAIKCLYNIINMRTGSTGSYGIQAVSSTATIPLFSEIKNNVILNAGYSGIMLNSASGSNSAGTPGEISNNMIGGGFSSSNGTGLYLTNASNWKVWHNTVNYDAAGTVYALSVQNGSGNDIRNNIFNIRNVSATLAIPVSISPASAVATFNYNNLFNAASTNLINIAGNFYTSSNYSGAYPAGAGINSRNMNPGFTSATNLHISEACMNGDNLGIATDIDGNPRGTTPDMGADEMTSVASLDASVLKINAPGFPFTAGTQPINITVQNNGNTTLTNLDIAYSVNGSAPVIQSWSGSLASCDTMNFIFTVSHPFGAGPNVLKVYVASPNGGADENRINDTATSAPFCVSLNGTYTINPAGSGPMNFISFDAAVSSLNCSGLTGPVVFNVADGTYNQQVTLGNIAGISATNTITFQSASGNAANVTLAYAPGSENYVLMLSGTDYVTFRNMTFTNSGNSNGYYNVLQIGNGAHYNTFRSCVFTNSTPTGGNLVNSSNTVDNNNSFIGNTFNGGSTGINWQSNTSSTYAQYLLIDSNTFNNQYNYAIQLGYVSYSKISNNQITAAPSTTYHGIYTQSTSFAQIVSNKIMISNVTSQAYGITLYGFNSSGNASARGLVANNMVKVGAGSGTSFGINIDNYGYFSDFIHNTVNITSTTGAGYALSVSYNFTGYSANDCSFINNIFQSMSSNASSYAFYHNQSATPTNVLINYNSYYVAAGNICRFQSQNRATLNDWKTANPTYNVNSLNKRAEFVSSNDLHHITPCLDNTGTNTYLSLIPLDVDGQSRNASAPDLGADEFTPLPYDIRVSRITAPTGYNASPQTVKAWIVNGGSTTVTSAGIGYSINGNTPVVQNFTGLSLAACDSVEVSFTTQLSTPTGYSVLQAFVSGNINGSNADGNGLNDTAAFAFCTSLSGNFTINAALSLSSTNFQSFGSAVNAMKSCGLSGPVTFTVAPGTYNEQVIISNIPGVSASNTITFDGVDSSNRTIQYNLGGSTSRYVIMVDSCRYVTIKNLKITSTNVNYAWGILVRGTTTAYNSDFVTIRKCAFVLPVTNSSGYAGIVAANSLSSATTANNYAQNITIDSNTVTGGYYGVIINGVSTTTRSYANAINNNTFYHNYYSAVYAQNQSDLRVNRNSVYNTGRGILTPSNTFTYPVYLQYADSFEVTRNKIYGAIGGYGLYANNCAGVNGSPNLVANNMIQIGEGNNTSQAVYLSNSPYTSLYHNSLYSTGIATSTSNNALYAQSSNNLVVANNNLSTLYNTANYVVYYPSTTVAFSNYNNYFGGTYYNGQSSVNGLKNTLYTGNDTSSKNADPGYVSISDLHTPTNTILDNAGAPVSLVTEDIDGETRDLVKPDIGADEFSAPTENSGVVAIVNPRNPITAGTNEVHVIIRNFGASVLTSDSVIYQVGSTIHRRLWTGSLVTNATDTVKFTATSGTGSSDQRYTFPSGSSTIKAWTAYPNGIADVSNADDTATSVVCTGYAGTYTIDPAGSGPNNFTSFGAAADALQCGITSPVVFNVAAGTYAEQFTINAIPGSSSVNTVLFQAANGIASSVKIQFSGSASDNYVMKLAGTDYITFDKLTFSALSGSYGMVIDIVNYNVTDKPGNIAITNCFINGTTQNTSTNFTLINAMVETPNLVITGNTFTKGSYAANITGNNNYPFTDGIRFNNNTIGTSNTDGPYYMGINALYTRNLQVIGNVFTASGYSNYTGINLQVSSGKVKINNNKVNAANGGYGIQLGSVNYNNEADSGEVINNVISVGGTNTAYGLLLQSCSNFNVYHNSINNYSTSASTYALRSYSSGTNHRKNRLQNNLLVSTTGYAIYLDGNNTTNAAAFFQLSDYNNMYTGGSNLGFIVTTGNLASLTNIRDVMYVGNDVNSVSGNPVYVSATDLVPTSCKPNAAGIAIPGFTTDITGASRKAIPDMGAYEFTPALPAPTVTSPVNLCYGSTATALTATSPNIKLWFTAASGGTGSTTAIVPNTNTRASQVYYVADSSASSGCTSSRAAITVNIDTAITNNTISSDQSICSGSTPAALTGTTPGGGNGTFAYSWVSSTTSATTGYAAASGTNNTSGYAPGALSVTTWYKRIVSSGVCGTDSSAAIEISMSTAVANNSITSSPQTICAGSTPGALTASTPTGGSGTYIYAWISSTTSASTGYAAASGTNNASGYTPGALSATTWFKRVVMSGTCGSDTSAAIAVTVTQAIANNSITSAAQSICSGSTPSALTASTPTGGSGIFTFKWLSSTTSATSGFAPASGTNDTNGYAPSALSATTWFRRVVVSGTCNSDTSAAVDVTANAPGYWMGNVSSAWNNTANWSCPQLPNATTDVTISGAFAPNQPVITDVQQARSVDITGGGVLTLNNTNSVLRVFGNVTGSGTLTHTNGKIIMEGTTAQTLKGGTYHKLEINNSNGLSLGGNTTLNDSLLLTNGILTLDANNLTMGNTSLASAAGTASYVKTNGSGRLIVQNIGTGGKTGNVSIPVGNSTYNPVVLNNAGTADTYTFQVIDSVTNNYSGDVPTGAKLTSHAVNRTWIINEAVAGGSNASVRLQWNASDELNLFSRNCYVAHYNGTMWISGSASPATITPLTQIMTGVTSFSPFGVGSNGVLPVDLLTFTGTKKQNNAVLSWSTASEKNNKGFEIQRSEDGKTWSFVDFVEGAGSTNAIRYYSFTDFNAFKPGVKQVYYRLNQVDLNGSQSLSNVVIITNETTGAITLNVQPNPFSHALAVSITSPVDENAILTITDVSGKMVATHELACAKGDNTISIPGAEHLRSGMYFITIKLGNEVLTRKVVKE